jgi:hypothetical protein
MPGLASGLSHQAPIDPAVIVGLAIGFAKQRSSGRGDRAGAVPGPVLAPLEAAARGGCGASAMVIDWLSRRGAAIDTELAGIDARGSDVTPRFNRLRDGADHE